MLLYDEAKQRILKYNSDNIKNAKKNIKVSKKREKRKINVKSIIFIIWLINVLTIYYVCNNYEEIL